MPQLASLVRIARIATIGALGSLLLAACAQGETLDGFGGSNFTSGSGGTAGTSTGKATGSSANASTNAVVSSSAASTKSASSSNASTTNASTVASTTAAPAASTTVVTTGGAVCFDVCNPGAPPPPTYPIDCIMDQNTLACITGICIGDADCCEVAWDDTCVLAAVIACGC